MEPTRSRQLRFSGWYFVIAIVVILMLQYIVPHSLPARRVPYSEFLAMVEAGRFSKAEVRETTVIGELKEPGESRRARHVEATRLPGMDETILLEQLREQGVVFSGRIEATSLWRQMLLGWMLPLGILLLFYLYGMRRIGKAGGPLSFGRSRAKVYDRSKEERATFDDVAGVDEAKAELAEVIDFLTSPDKYRDLGAKIPKGVLLVGPPGTGKTLLARAVAGEAKVPFFTMTGSDFVEMFVGVGASRVRDLFQQAKERAPCIVFIDELDAIGKSRGGLAAMASNDEREQTLNQLLAEMDGFDPTVGVIIMAATNRPEVLDPALLRAGRFDRRVVVDRPDVRGREQILQVHTRKVKLGDNAELKVIARRTPGMSGADLANTVNEATLAAARRGSSTVEPQDFEEAIDRIQLGLKKTSRAMNEDEKRRVAFHESGHALVALSVKHADPVHRVTIIPRSIGALGATLQLPTEDRYLVTRDELSDRICVMLGGRAAEEIVCNDVSTGAQDDLERATETARQMVCRFGMSETLGLVTLGRPAGARFLNPAGFGEERNYSEETARTIDAEVRSMVAAQYTRAQQILRDRRSELNAVTKRLLEQETLERDELEALATPVTVADESMPAKRIAAAGTGP
ncbi:MAG: ATP-dependent zinc metalloprotease FtsH [Proteobacteria bacterium]|nr:ATP-dependent zinc metalloprotease FtsH [Pseudomonadota bacterium]